MSNARTLASLIDGSNIVVPSGYGLDFSANANASGMTSEVLDDYEEGTWTPTWVVATGSITAFSPHTSGFYRKIGDVVYIWGYIAYSSKSGTNNSDPLNVGGLPFQSISSGFGQSGNQAGGVHMFAEILWSSNSPQGGRIPSGGNTILLTHSRNSQNSSNVTVGDMGLSPNYSQTVFYGQYLT